MNKLLMKVNARKQLEKQLKEYLFKMDRYSQIDDVLFEVYSKKVDITLERIEKYNKTVTKREKLDPNTILKAIGSMAGLMLVIDYERGGGFTGKAFSMVDKIKN